MFCLPNELKVRGALGAGRNGDRLSCAVYGHREVKGKCSVLCSCARSIDSTPQNIQSRDFSSVAFLVRSNSNSSSSHCGNGTVLVIRTPVSHACTASTSARLVSLRFEALEGGDGATDSGEMLRRSLVRQPMQACLCPLGQKASS